MVKGILVEQPEGSPQVGTVPLDEPKKGECRIESRWSSLNYKDALAYRGHPGVVRSFPHVPGIDVAGTLQGDCGKLSAGSEVLVTGFDFGAGKWGGWSTACNAQSGWLVPLPAGLSQQEAMALGTAGFTAALSVDAILNQGIHPDDGEVVVTGSTGGVGCLAIQILAKLGFRVVAATRKQDQFATLQQWGAQRAIELSELTEESSKPLQKSRWVAAVDTVGGEPLAGILRQMKPRGCVTACGMVASDEFTSSVFPFILRGISLFGIDSAWCPPPKRRELWAKLADAWKPGNLKQLCSVVNLEQLPEKIDQMLAGKHVGRVLIEIA